MKPWLVVARLATAYALAQIDAGAPKVYIKLSPLIGGPRAVRVHSAIMMDSGVGDGVLGWDLVPAEPQSRATLARLATGRAADGVSRRLADADARGLYVLGAAAASADAVDAVAAARPKALRLWDNSCWTHSVAVASAALGVGGPRAIAAIARALLGRAQAAPAPAVTPPSRDATAAAFADEKAARFGADLGSLLSAEERRRAARTARAIEAAIRDAED